LTQTGADPRNDDVYHEVGRRIVRLIDGAGDTIGEVGRHALSRDGHVLAESPTSVWPIIVARVCRAAGGCWQRAIWPAAAMECAMAAADLFDDLADGENIDLLERFSGGEVLTVAAGLLALAGDAALRATEDGVPEAIAVQLGQALGKYLAQAADGQAKGLKAKLQVGTGDEAVVAAYRLAALKSGPLGSLVATLGALAAEASPAALEQYTIFGWHTGVASQLINDGFDAMPDRPLHKRDVRAGTRTVPLVFAESNGAPAGLDAQALADWEEAERRRVAEAGGIIVAELLAKADWLRAEAALDRLAELGHEVAALRELLALPRSQS
jgi:geranylgeranyl pyrophosphate synthase